MSHGRYIDKNANMEWMGEELRGRREGGRHGGDGRREGGEREGDMEGMGEEMGGGRETWRERGGARYVKLAFSIPYMSQANFMYLAIYQLLENKF